MALLDSSRPLVDYWMMTTSKTDWDEWSDEYGQCYVNPPYLIRQYRSANGETVWQLTGAGEPVESDDLSFLQREAAEHRRSASSLPLTRELGDLSAGATGGGIVREDRMIDTARYKTELTELRHCARALARMVSGVNNIYREAAVVNSRDVLESVRADVQSILDRLP